MHARALAKAKLDDPLSRFVHHVETSSIALLSAHIEDSPTKSVELDLVRWVSDAMFQGATDAMFGPAFLPTAGLSQES